MAETVFYLVAGALLLAFGGEFVVRVGLSALGDKTSGVAAAVAVLIVTLGSVFPEASLIYQTQKLNWKLDNGGVWVTFDNQGYKDPVTLDDRSSTDVVTPACEGCRKYKANDNRWVEPKVVQQIKDRISVSVPLGIIFGGCLLNLLLIVGIAGLRTGKPIPTSLPSLMRDALFLAAGLVYAAIVILHWKASWADHLGLGGIGIAVLYLFVVIATERPQNADSLADTAANVATPGRATGAMAILYIAGGALALWFGAKFIMDVISDHVMMLYFNNSHGLLDAFAPVALFGVAGIVALPELMAALVSSRNGDAQLATRTLISAAVLNLLAVLGFAVWRFKDIGATAHLNFAFDLGMLAIASFFVVLLLASKAELSRGESAFLILLYVVYVGMRFVPIAPTPTDREIRTDIPTLCQTVTAADFVNKWANNRFGEAVCEEALK